MRRDGRPDEGLRIAVIGGGPAGSVCALALLYYARRAERDVEVVIFDRKSFVDFGPRGCNMCAGVISDTLVRNLEHLGIVIPPAAIQQEILGYQMETRAGSLRLGRPARSTIYAVYRGIGPRGLEYDEARSFDLLLLRSAIECGAKHISQTVTGIELPRGPGGTQQASGRGESAKGGPGPGAVLYGGGERYVADVIVGAFGVNSTLPRYLEGQGIGYRPPRTVQACQAEVPLDEAFIRERYRGEIKIFNLGLPGIRFASITPKQRHVTVSLVGPRVEQRDLEAFLQRPEVRAHFPPGWHVPRGYCLCYPRLPVTGARRPYADGFVVVGDAYISRYLKDGIGSAFYTGFLAAQTIMTRGIGRRHFRRHYAARCWRRYFWDNVCGKLIFAYNDLVARSSFLVAAYLRLARREAREEAPGEGTFSRVAWEVFTGDAPYHESLLEGVNPRLTIRLVAALGRELRARLRPAPSPQGREPASGPRDPGPDGGRDIRP